MGVLDRIEMIVFSRISNDKGEVVDDFSFGTMGGKGFSYMLHYNFSFLEFFTKEEVIMWFREHGWDI